MDKRENEASIGPLVAWPTPKVGISSIDSDLSSPKNTKAPRPWLTRISARRCCMVAVTRVTTLNEYIDAGTHCISRSNLPIYLSTYLHIYISILSTLSTLPTLPTLSTFSTLSTYLPIYLSTYLPIYLSIYLSTYLPIYLSIYLSVYLSI